MTNQLKNRTPKETFSGNAVGGLYHGTGEFLGRFCFEVMKGFGYCLEDIKDDIDIINRALYCHDEKNEEKTPSESDKAPISEQ
jgi:hypothetical protein